MLCMVISILFIVVLYRWLTEKKSDSVTCLVGKTAIVTGGNEGIGYEIVILLASRGCKVIIADKVNSEKSVEKIRKLTNNNNIFYKNFDLSSFASIRKCADKIKLAESKIDILINNAGINGFDAYTTEDGLSSVMQVNYFGAFLLTHLLLDQLKKADQARIIFVGSILAYINNLSVDNLVESTSNIVGSGFNYSNSKYCNILAAQEFGSKLKKYNIMVYSADPGIIRTKIFRQKKRWLDIVSFAMLWFLGNDASIGAQTAFHLASRKESEGKTGGCYFLCRQWVKPWGLQDAEFCRKIWKRSEELVNLAPNERI